MAPGRLDELRIINPVLTTLAQGYSNAEFVGMNLFPLVPVPSEKEQVVFFDKESFRVETTKRAIRAVSNVMSPPGRTVQTFTLHEHDLVYPIDYREEAESMFNEEQFATLMVQEKIQLEVEKEQADRAQDASNYPGGHTVTLSGTSQWTHADSNPIGDIDAGKVQIRSAIAREPNTLVMGYLTFQALKEHPKIIEKIKYSMKGIASIDILKEVFDIPNLVVGKGVYLDPTDNTVLLDLWSDNAVLAYVDQEKEELRNKKKLSFGYTLRKTGNPLVDTFYINPGKVKGVRNTDIQDSFLVGASCGYLILDTNA